MNVVNSGSSYQIYGNGLNVYKALPSQVYEVTFSQFTGFSLVQHDDLEVNEDKIYGSYDKRADKILKSFGATNRNLGVILSGIKGSGKSLFARMLSEKALKANMPVIIVSDYVPGIANFISSINQEVMILFDEFEKIFSKNKDRDPQEELLSLFDGIDSGKKLFIITCNEVYKLNDYYLNRPGRFHYHFIFSYPSIEEITEYVNDKLLPKYKHNIPHIIRFATRTNVTYDILRAIVFDLNLGYDFVNTILDLNIEREKNQFYRIVIELSNGVIIERTEENIDFYSGRTFRFWSRDRQNGVDIQFEFIPSDAEFNEKNGNLTLDPTLVTMNPDDSDFEEKEDYITYTNAVSVTSVSFIKEKINNSNKYNLNLI